MKMYCTQTIKSTIADEGDSIRRIEVGMMEDWFSTAATVYEGSTTACEAILYASLDGKAITVVGIVGSKWATPVMVITYRDGALKILSCFFEGTT